ncbi:hypothetical protein NDU88_004843 [Pleurodeles waltl]|uniref:Uncharacterized protein n=1 Tax=Pleurodeles waltl TaxID=8319 RepID=A0AAV7LJC0_PLEWA|nr:hypothetical protein NDU88_004843 [Pleurodeles waltl]
MPRSTSVLFGQEYCRKIVPLAHPTEKSPVFRPGKESRHCRVAAVFQAPKSAPRICPGPCLRPESHGCRPQLSSGQGGAVVPDSGRRAVCERAFPVSLPHCVLGDVIKVSGQLLFTYCFSLLSPTLCATA